jgi:NADH-quinone oxidoreductase subunit M
MIYDRAHTRNMDELSGMRKALPWTVVAFIIGGLVSMGMPGLSGFLAEFPIFLGVWEGRGIDLNAVFGLNPSNFYGWVAIIAVLGIIITAAYILRAVHSVFFGEYEGEKWHDMRPLLSIDKFTLLMFSVILIVIGVFPVVIAPIVESGMEPVASRLQEAQQAAQFHGGTVTGAAQHMIQIVAANVMAWLGGA